MVDCKYVFFFLFVLLPGTSMAMSGKGHGNCANCHTMTVAEAGRLMKSIGGTVKNVKMAPVSGLFELAIEKDGRKGTAYIDFEKKHIMPGPIYDLTAGKPINQPPASTRRVDVGKITKDYSIVMGNPKGTKKLFVFTDPDCPYCAKFHTELKKLVTLDKSVTIYIKMFPLPMHPQAYDKARVILGRNSLELLEKAFSGGTLPPAGQLESKKPVDETITLAKSLGINVTPTLVLPDGRVIPGEWDVSKLQQFISGKK